MILEELVSAFLYSRKHGLKQVGAKKKASEETVVNYEHQLNRFLNFVQDERQKTKWNQLTRDDIRAYVEFVNDHEDWSASTKSTYLRSLRTLMHFIELDDECKGLNSWRKELPAISSNEQKKHIPSPQDLKKWRAEFDTNSLYGYRNYVAFCIWLDTGLRLTELSTLRVDGLQLDNKQIFINRGKGGPRNVPVSNQVVKLLKGWLKRRVQLSHAADSPFVFVGHRAERCGKSGFGQMFRKMRAKNPALPKVTAHLLRHSFGTYFLTKDNNLERLRMLMGHSDVRTTSKYMHLAQVGSADTREAVERASPLAMLDRTRTARD